MGDLYELFDVVRSRSGDAVAVEVQRSGAHDTFSYDDLGRMAGRTASRLRAAGCRQGDRVALLAPNDASWCGAFLGILRLGAVAVPLDTAYRPQQVATLLDDCGVGQVIAGAQHEPVAREAISLGDRPVELLRLEPTVGEQIDNTVPAAGAAAGDPAVILYTSGTTSDPKGVVLTHGNLMAERDSAFQIFTFDENDAVLSVLPLFHALALLANLLLPFSVGARVVFLESVNTSELLRALQERGITVFCCVPQFFYLIHERVLREVGASGVLTRIVFRGLLALNGWLRRGTGFNLGKVFFGRIHRTLGPRIRILLTGGSRFDPAIGAGLVSLGFDIRQAYGLTECSGAATVTRPGDLDLASVGPPLPGVEISIDPGDSQPGSAGEPHRDGEVLIRGDIVMPGYYNRPDANAVVLENGWLRTGDLGFLDPKGLLHVTGRKKEVIVLASGKNIFPEEIEGHYLKSEFIKELCVIGRTAADDPTDLQLYAVIVPDVEVLHARKMVNVAEQMRFEIENLSVRLPNQKRILGYEIRFEDLPRTTTRKLKRFAIERQVSERANDEIEVAPARLRPEDVAWMEDPGVERLIAALRVELKPGALVTPDANLELDLGLDSMTRVELMATLEQSCGVRVAEEAAQKIYTVRDVVEAVRTAPGDLGPTGTSTTPWDRLLGEAREDDPVLQDLLRPRRIRKLVLFGVTKLCYLLARVLLRFRADGVERLPASGSFILSPNHQSFLDGILVVSALPYRVFQRTFLVGATEFFSTPFMAWLARQINVVPVDPDANLIKAMQAGALGLSNGMVLILFPEGERSIDGTIKMFKKGAAILSLHLQVPVVPVAMDGAFEVWPRNRPLQWRKMLPGGGAKVSMQVGAPVAPNDTEIAERRYEATTDRIREAVQGMWARLRRSPMQRI